MFFSDQGRAKWGEHWQGWVSAFSQGKAVLTDNSGHYVQFDEPQLVVSELLALFKKLERCE